jgi:hypothetical protein
MGYNFGGILFKNGNKLSDDAILHLLRRESHVNNSTVNMEDATASYFDGIGIARFEELLMVFGIDIPHACSFENEPLSPLDLRLEKLSNEGDILCFSINSRMDTYAWSIYIKGKRVRTKLIVEAKTLAEIGDETQFDIGLEPTDSGMIKLINNFIEYDFSDLVYEKGIPVKAFYK